MGKTYKTIVITLFLLGCIHTGYAQEEPDYDRLRDTLNELTSQIPALDVPVSISVTNVNIQEFLRGVGNKSGLNIHVQPGIEERVVNNFSEVKVKDILLFICQEYGLGLSYTGNIITVYKIEEPEVEVVKDPTATYNAENDRLTLDYNEDNLSMVVKELTQLTGKNVIKAPQLQDVPVSGYIQNSPFDQALEKIAYTNNLELEKTDDGFYIFKAVPGSQDEEQNNRTERANSRYRPESRGRNDQQGQSDNYVLEVNVLGEDSVSVIAKDAPIIEIIDEAAFQLNKSYFTLGEIAGSASVNSQGIGFEDLLKNVLYAGNFIYRKEGNVYVLGDIKNSHLKEYTSIQLQHRTIDKMLDFIPKDLVDGLEIVEFPEDNSFLVAGSTAKVDELKRFMRKIDRIVPVVLIEVMIADVNKSSSISTGMELGLGDESRETKGTVSPGIDMQYSSESINKVLNSFEGFGSMKLGNLAPNFYMTLRAMESQGLLTLRSTPKLSTLNGHEATLNIGNTEYYLETQSNIISSNNPIESRSQTYKSVEATLSVVIKPIVSGDEQITLDIEVEQSDFTERISEFAPPGTVTRNFKSLIRVRNQETVLLGGLEEKRKDNSTTGLPFLARVPVLKWFFSNRIKDDSNSKLSIFIKPTIIN